MKRSTTLQLQESNANMAADDDVSTGNKGDVTLVLVMEKLEYISQEISSLKHGQTTLTTSMDFINEKFENLLYRISELEETNKNLEKTNTELRNRITTLEIDANQQNQYSRRNNLEISGIPERENENTDDITLSVLRNINPGISIDDIDVTHRIGKVQSPTLPHTARHRPIIVAFTNRRSRNAIYDQRRKIKDISTENLGYSTKNNIYINENLCPAARQLQGKVNNARKKSGYRYLWTHNGRIYIKRDQQARSITISNEADIAKYCT
ncbi:uncharacterized protein LOC144453647 [Glandiceps talaboti]